MSAFTDWLDKEHPLTARAAVAQPDGTFRIVRDAMEIAWDAALEYAARKSDHVPPKMTLDSGEKP